MGSCLTRYTFDNTASKADAQGGRAVAHVSRFRPPGGGADEIHICVKPTEAGAFASQLEAVTTCYEETCRALALSDDSLVLQRVLSSDAANQEAHLQDLPIGGDSTPATVSLVQQPPLPAAKLVLWAYHIQDRAPLRKQTAGPNAVAIERGGLTHLW